MLSGDQIRVMELLPSGDEGPAAPLRCHVHIVSLSSNPDYEAVSYVWGVPDGKTSIEVSGRSFGISSNLDALLRRLRYTNRKRQIWADQICIDQNNLSEKTTQVKMMGDIYSKCRQCLIWMGEIPESVPQSGVEDAIHLLEFMATPDDVNVPEFLSTRDKFIKVFEVLYLIHPHGNTWWSRIWTVQEVILPERKTILWGPKVLSWELLSQAMHTWTTQYMPSLMDILLDEDFQEMNALSANIVWINYGRNSDLPSILVTKWRNRKATDMRDKVFGLLGLVPDHVDLEYTGRRTCESSVAEVFSSLTLDAILSTDSLQPLVLNPRLEDDIATEGISRWAMDLKGFPKRDADTFYRDWAHDHYNACNGRALDRAFLRSTVEAHAGSTRVLGVSGVMVDTVQIISPQRSTAPESDARISENLRAWYKLAASRQPGGVSAATRPEFDEQFCRLVVADILEPRDEDDPESQSRMPNAEDLENAWRFVEEGIQGPGELWIKESHMPSQLCNQIFFVTASGMMGMGPWDTLPGDEVWVFDGGNYPFTIRPRHERGSKGEFDFVGCCYIQGIMFGEWFQKQEELSTQRIYIY
ncbi:hypothetical protein QIS74_01341 [Colletotrichum tabaci]|uniref:Heterokaryon incompatibility domain-containing protein n=1 Tax=Colletotrichum tabaci TaxID=1209068 RepID=A0AAV9TPR8_9PEZI